MTRKPRPKYPNRDRVLFRRFVTQALLILCAVAVALFYVYMNQSNQEEDPMDPAGTTRETPAKAEQNLLPAAPGKTEATNRASSPPSSRSAAGRASSPDTTAPQKPAAAAPPAVAPHGEKSLKEVGAALAKAFATVQPALWGERLPGVTSRLPVSGKKSAKPVVALTLDACGGKKGESYDAPLIAFLREKKIPATLFVTSAWMQANPDILRNLAADPLFEIAAHGARHKPCSINGKSAYDIKGTASFFELAEEVEGNVRALAKATGTRPRWFRSGTAYYDEVAVSAIRSLGLDIAGYSIAGDEGATLSPDRVAAKTLTARHGDILLYHMNKPASGTCKGLKASLPALLDKGFVFVKLSDPP